MNKLNLKYILSICSGLICILFFALFLYIKNNVSVYTPPKRTRISLGILSGASDDIVDNSIFFSPSSYWENKYNISPESGDANGPIQVYTLTNKNNKADNRVIVGYFQRDDTTDIDIEINSLDPPQMKVHEVEWLFDFLND